MTNKGADMLVGLAQRASAIASGGFLAERAIRGGHAKLVIVAADAAKNTEKRMRDKCKSYKVPLITYGTGAHLGRIIGKEHRAVIAITDAGFAKAVYEKIEETANIMK
ncbi:MAG: ribosomal L7Ae/L30e/S12e/Gadd45 family protein [Eubacteriales bacterium]|nr:ribosomal L7Ae/L30e/S12e/Gadd45 family protein [Eubacteriales bacterium]